MAVILYSNTSEAVWLPTTCSCLQFVHLLFLWWLPCNEVTHGQQTERNTPENQLLAFRNAACRRGDPQTGQSERGLHRGLAPGDGDADRTAGADQRAKPAGWQRAPARCR